MQKCWKASVWYIFSISYFVVCLCWRVSFVAFLYIIYFFLFCFIQHNFQNFSSMTDAYLRRRRRRNKQKTFLLLFFLFLFITEKTFMCGGYIERFFLYFVFLFKSSLYSFSNKLFFLFQFKYVIFKFNL